MRSYLAPCLAVASQAAPGSPGAARTALTLLETCFTTLGLFASPLRRACARPGGAEALTALCALCSQCTQGLLGDGGAVAHPGMQRPLQALLALCGGVWGGCCALPRGVSPVLTPEEVAACVAATMGALAIHVVPVAGPPSPDHG